MADIIKLLPDSVANQIAAGEVIQRPASAVKELMENAIDSGADNISLIVKDAGRTLIQVVDNGCGMSETDARLSFERHATSKINDAKDLFTIRTMGFRGEALASICAIAHLEMKTKREQDTLGTHIINEGSVVKSQEMCQCEKGTSIAVKNLFFNVPARRNFLKSEQVELKHITDEFLKLALSHPHIAFTFFHNNNEVYHLVQGNLKKRIISCYGNSYNERLIVVEHTSDTVSFSGFISKPEFSKKTRGEQYFFTNKRFMRHNYLNHAVFTAYNELIKKDTFPSFFIFIDIDPEQIDVNIHPTKTEIKFQDERLIYSFLNATIKKALGVHNVLPSLDFTKDKDFDVTPLSGSVFVEPPKIKYNPDFDPFKENTDFKRHTTPLEKSNKQNWQKLYDELSLKADGSQSDKSDNNSQSENVIPALFDFDEGEAKSLKMIHLHKQYIITQVKSGVMIVSQLGAEERILYEKFKTLLENRKSFSQQLLFPQLIDLSPADLQLVKDLKEEFKILGFDMAFNESNAIVVNGAPLELDDEDLQGFFEKMIENFKGNQISMRIGRAENMAACMARQVAIKNKKSMQLEEMNSLIDKLFACENPYYTPYGKATFCIIKTEEIENLFNQKKQ